MQISFNIQRQTPIHVRHLSFLAACVHFLHYKKWFYLVFQSIFIRLRCDVLCVSAIGFMEFGLSILPVTANRNQRQSWQTGNWYINSRSHCEAQKMCHLTTRGRCNTQKCGFKFVCLCLFA